MRLRPRVEALEARRREREAADDRADEAARYGTPLDGESGDYRHYRRWDPAAGGGRGLSTLTVVGPAGAVQYEVVGIDLEELT